MPVVRHPARLVQVPLARRRLIGVKGAGPREDTVEGKETPMTAKPTPLKHPIRDGFGFLAAAVMAVVRLFIPGSRRSADTAEKAATKPPGAEGP